MPERSYSLLSTPLDLHASIDDLIRNYELVRQNIRQIFPSLPLECEIDLLAGETPHNQQPAPLLGLHIPIGPDGDTVDPLDVQAAIENWFSKLTIDNLSAIRNELEFPRWNSLVAKGIHPNRDDSKS